MQGMRTSISNALSEVGIASAGVNQALQATSVRSGPRTKEEANRLAHLKQVKTSLKNAMSALDKAKYHLYEAGY